MISTTKQLPRGTICLPLPSGDGWGEGFALRVRAGWPILSCRAAGDSEALTPTPFRREKATDEFKARARPVLLAAIFVLTLSASAFAQAPAVRSGEVIPRDVREMYDRGLQFLATSQTEAGDWASQSSDNGPGATGVAIMALLASGEDPNFGLYAGNVRRALRSLIAAQDASTGILGNSMYHHGFAMLGLAEAYGAVDERTLWPDGKGPRSVGQALELAVRAALTSQKNNPLGAWRYSPAGRDADTSVSGAVLVGLLAARNAGVEVPDAAIDRAIAYFKSMTSTPSGFVAYAGGMGGFGESTARSSIATLVYAVARRKDMPEFKATLSQIKDHIGGGMAQFYLEYTRYYQAQALFQGDVAAWEKWNTNLVRELKASQGSDGSFRGQHGPGFTTSMSLLALALNYRFLPIYER